MEKDLSMFSNMKLVFIEFREFQKQKKEEGFTLLQLLFLFYQSLKILIFILHQKILPSKLTDQVATEDKM
jgi:hypothetical protein